MWLFQVPVTDATLPLPGGIDSDLIFCLNVTHTRFFQVSGKRNRVFSKSGSDHYVVLDPIGLYPC